MAASLGFRHSKETIAKFKELAKHRVYSEEAKAITSKMYLYRTALSRENDIKRMLELNSGKGHAIEVFNISNQEKKDLPFRKTRSL